jgi:hypothetical protein
MPVLSFCYEFCQVLVKINIKYRITNIRTLADSHAHLQKRSDLRRRRDVVAPSA